MTLYRFLNAEMALKTLRERRLRVGRLKELNDPFEWEAGIIGIVPWGEDVARKFLENFVSDMNDWLGLLCLSDTLVDPVLWSHYADKHAGIALEFDFDDREHLHKMVYTDDRPTIDANRIQDEAKFEAYARPVLERLLVQKSKSWAYEKEYRAFIELADCDEDHGQYFKQIPESFLTRVVLGCRCAIAEAEVKKALEVAGLADTKVIRGKKCLRSYQILA
jgi:hypothetical protein